MAGPTPAKVLRLAHRPTPLEAHPRLGAWLGAELWIKRDDATGGAEAGNKIRKLERLLAHALERGADTVVSCGSLQSNHARAVALATARLGLKAELLLRVDGLDDDDDGAGIPLARAAQPLAGNLLIDCLAGARVRLIRRESYARRDALMARRADELRAAGAEPYVIPEGGSNGLGALAYVDAMAEVQTSLAGAGAQPFDCVAHACGSGGTAAGVALGAAAHDAARSVLALAICDDQLTFEHRIAAIIDEARALEPSLGLAAPWRVDAGAADLEVVTEGERQQATVQAARLAGVLLDPAYGAPAFARLKQLADAGELAGKRLLWISTGGLPALLAQPDRFSAVLS
jgi:D-cysteine desulfhydrase